MLLAEGEDDRDGQYRAEAVCGQDHGAAGHGRVEPALDGAEKGCAARGRKQSRSQIRPSGRRPRSRLVPLTPSTATAVVKPAPNAVHAVSSDPAGPSIGT